MRTVYTGLYYKDYRECKKHTENIAQMTHYDALSTEICVLYAELIRLLVTGEKDVPYYLMDKWLKDNPMVEMPAGWIKDSFNCALHSFLETYTIEEAFIRAVNLGDDADTIGAITGGLVGAWYGFDQLPRRWVNCLSGDVTNQLDYLADKAFGV